MFARSVGSNEILTMRTQHTILGNHKFIANENNCKTARHTKKFNSKCMKKISVFCHGRSGGRRRLGQGVPPLIIVNFSCYRFPFD